MKASVSPLSILLLGILGFLSGCATRPVNPPVTQIDPDGGYRFETRHRKAVDQENLVILAFSGGGTRAAAFSYGVLEFLRRAEMIMPNGQKVRMLDEIDRRGTAICELELQNEALKKRVAELEASLTAAGDGAAKKPKG